MGGKSGSTKANNACFLDNLADLLRGDYPTSLWDRSFRPLSLPSFSMTIAVTSPPVGWGWGAIPTTLPATEACRRPK